LKILHVSHSALPDGRIEKMGLLDKLLGHETVYLGTETRGPTLQIFDNVYHTDIDIFMCLGLPNRRVSRQKIKNYISKINPDIIHLHNVQLYDVVASSGYPYILDDHEYLSKEFHCDSGRRIGIKRKLIFPYQLFMWRRRERHAARHVPIINVSEPIADYYRSLGSNAKVIPNYPSQYELSIAKFSDKVDDLTSVYLGNTALKDTCVYRNSTGFVEYFKEINKALVCVGNTEHKPSNRVSFTGYIPHIDIFEEMSKHHVGIIPWRKHPFHRYCCPNKAFFYAHCGMVVIVTSLFENVIKQFQGRCRTVENYKDLALILEAMEEDMDAVLLECDENRQFARENFVFENYIDILEEAYKNA